ncbi:DUF397 domain-containing protein [Actinomadura scrupuli]|uniref:DUF397 domain-containing protein n=1 Tax=Actinomadura scrupuli TaxID=559629 RepID=UPI003D95CD6C
MGREMEGQQLTPWRKSIRSGNGGNTCVEVALWRKGTRSANGGDTCVEVAPMGRVIAVRDSKDPDGPRLRFSPAVWGTFTDRVKHGGPSTPRS